MIRKIAAAALTAGLALAPIAATAGTGVTDTKAGQKSTITTRPGNVRELWDVQTKAGRALGWFGPHEYFVYLDPRLPRTSAKVRQDITVRWLAKDGRVECLRRLDHWATGVGLKCREGAARDVVGNPRKPQGKIRPVVRVTITMIEDRNPSRRADRALRMGARTGSSW